MIVNLRATKFEATARMNHSGAFHLAESPDDEDCAVGSDGPCVTAPLPHGAHRHPRLRLGVETLDSFVELVIRLPRDHVDLLVQTCVARPQPLDGQVWQSAPPVGENVVHFHRGQGLGG